MQVSLADRVSVLKRRNVAALRSASHLEGDHAVLKAAGRVRERQQRLNGDERRPRAILSVAIRLGASLPKNESASETTVQACVESAPVDPGVQKPSIKGVSAACAIHDIDPPRLAKKTRNDDVESRPRRFYDGGISRARVSAVQTAIASVTNAGHSAGEGVRVAAKSSFAFNGAISTRTFCKPLILPKVGLLPGPPLMIIATDFIYLSRLSVAPHTTVRQ